ncbi:MAG: O-antigen ligase family protein [Edaphobacter sp.]
MRMGRPLGVLSIVSLLGILPAFTNIKLGSLQVEDFVLVLLLGFCVAKYLSSGFSFRISSKLSSLFRSYGLLLLALFVMAVLALRLTFYPLDEVSLLKRPLFFSLSKLLQLAAIVCGFLWLTNVLVVEKKLLVRAMSVYWRTGVLTSWYALLSWLVVTIGHVDPSSTLGSILGAYSVDYAVRARGFFNEGGPFGIFVISAVVIGLLRRHMTGRRLGLANVAALFLAFVSSESKAAFFLVLLLVLYLVIAAASFRKKVAYFILSTVIFCSVAAWLNLPLFLSGYINSYHRVEDNVAALGRDPNAVLGRVAALYIVPRMISAHPITGVGIGNYPLMRNDPHYLGSLPTITDVEDLPAIGIPGITAEIGIPATLWLMFLLLAPFWACRKKASLIGAAAIFQLLAHTFGVQLTFFYPWFVSACAFAASSYEQGGYISQLQRSPLRILLRSVAIPVSPISTGVH